MPRHILEQARIHPAIRDTIAAHKVVVVGMAQNPMPKKP